MGKETNRASLLGGLALNRSIVVPNVLTSRWFETCRFELHPINNRLYAVSRRAVAGLKPAEAGNQDRQPGEALPSKQELNTRNAAAKQTRVECWDALGRPREDEVDQNGWRGIQDSRGQNNSRKLIFRVARHGISGPPVPRLRKRGFLLNLLSKILYAAGVMSIREPRHARRQCAIHPLEAGLPAVMHFCSPAGDAPGRGPDPASEEKRVLVAARLAGARGE